MVLHQDEFTSLQFSLQAQIETVMLATDLKHSDYDMGLVSSHANNDYCAVFKTSQLSFKTSKYLLK